MWCTDCCVDLCRAFAPDAGFIELTEIRLWLLEIVTGAIDVTPPCALSPPQMLRLYYDIHDARHPCTARDSSTLARLLIHGGHRSRG